MDRISKYPMVVKNLNWHFGERQILHDINLTIEKKKFYSIIGPNGSGKTTLLRNLSKSLEPKDHTVYIHDVDLKKLTNKEVAKKIACVPQNTNIDFDFSVMDIVLMGRSPYFRPFQTEGEEDIHIARKAMKLTNVWHLKGKNINEISGGERQRVIIARALTQQPNIMLLDEPVSQLDIQHQMELMDTMNDLIADKGMTVVAVLHDLNLAAQYSDLLILLNEGKIVMQGTPESVLTRENIEAVYNIEVYIMNHPVTGKPHIIPVKRHNVSSLAG